MHFYYPAMQEVILEAAVQAGANVQRGNTALEVLPGMTPGVRVKSGNGEHTYRGRLVVGADGRNSNCRKWARFNVQHDPDRMIIAGVLFDNLDAPADMVNFFINPERSNFSVFTPLGGKRFRGYAGFYQQDGSRRWSGEKAVYDYIAGSVAAGAPEEWFAQAKVSGPLASFNCAEVWVTHPYQAGVALVGDAAATSDPSYGCGLSLVLRDVRILSEYLLADDNWAAAPKAYAAAHDQYFESIHHLVDWLTMLFYETGYAAAEQGERAFARILEDPKRLPDIPGWGPEAPSDEAAYRNLFGED